MTRPTGRPPDRPRIPADPALIAALAGSGLTNRQAAAQAGLSYSTYRSRKYEITRQRLLAGPDAEEAEADGGE